MRGICIVLAILLAAAHTGRAMTLPDAHRGDQSGPQPGESGGRALYLPILRREAVAAGVPPELADAVAMVETGYRPDAVGSSGEIGIMQVMPGTARQLGFTGSLSELAEPEANIRLGVRYLARAWGLGGGDVCRTLMKYRAGLGQSVMTALSRAYCTRAIAWLGGTGSLLAGASPDSPPAVAQGHDPHVIAIVPALAAQARPRPLLTGARALPTIRAQMASFLPNGSGSSPYRALNDRFLSHQRHYGPFANPPRSGSDPDD